MLTRHYRLDDSAVDGRTLHLRCVPFDIPATVDDGEGPYREVFRRGAFTHVCKAPNRTALRLMHATDPANLLGFGVELTEFATALEGHFRVAAGAAGDQTLALVADGQLGGVSVGFVSGSDRTMPDGTVERLRVAQLPEVSLTPAGSYAQAAVLAVRQAAQRDADIATARIRHSVWRLRYGGH